ncbi:peptide ABC transporter substrate-binding protein [Clostridiaceae bacterium UIB06]|uniref:Peptide ABC transporter substrate-binding protein n=1 Tax=Clostridium thailandense TaxID=2794346 RepID=A0A949X3W8_9CLOT|nr:peptide ABC transporter substrate-binding protein [Clostridium thailandense]MBV7273048.1 peptide ABC transporter substrate-binding protein [Clostridium thailandense]MCH5135712.1 peptide ABC transporter substrate-binding protein [Clostridiaceae bacterium UIB06]
MLKNKKFKLITLAAAIALSASVFAGCGSSSSNGSTTASGNKVIKVNIGADPKTIDPGLNNSVEGSHVIVNAFEGLTNLDKDEKVIPGVAEKWDVSKDGLHYTFHLRKDAKWSDGKPVKASDFEYAWKRALNPDTASEYAFQLFYLKNGEAYNQSKDEKATKKATADEVGVKATDDYTLDVTLEGATPYFLSLMAFPTYMPVRKDIVESHPKDWATKPETYVSNGPFMMKELKMKDSINFVKNPNYWNTKSVKLDGIQFKVLDQESSYFAAFKTGQIDMIDKPPVQEIPNLLKDGTAKSYPYLGTYYYDFNISANAANVNPDAAKALKDVRVRKALSLAIDRTAITKDVSKGGEIPATGFVPSGVTDEKGTKFKTKEYLNKTANVEEAKKLLAEAGYPDGKGFPKLEIIYNTLQMHQSIAVAVQDMWKKNLGIDITLRNLERKVQLTEANKHNFVVNRDGWIADYNDPMTFLDIFTTTNGNNYCGYNNPKYDELITAAKHEADSQKRTAMLHQAEDMLMEDMPIMPIFEYTEVVCMNKKLKDVHVSNLGFFIFRDADLEK